jgi:hypothetical protein
MRPRIEDSDFICTCICKGPELVRQRAFNEIMGYEEPMEQ